MKRVTCLSDSLSMSREQVRAFDRWAMDTLGIPGMVLMENAGRSCAELIRDCVENKPETKICIICGTGNNGGDGFVIARHLLNLGLHVDVFICGDPTQIQGDAAANLAILRAMNVAVEIGHPLEESTREYLYSVAAESDLIVDALFGTGLTGKLRGGYEQIVACINALKRPILAVDIPSGLDCNTGEVLGHAILATWTVTFVAVKQGFCRPGAPSVTGSIYVASIGIDTPFWVEGVS